MAQSPASSIDVRRGQTVEILDDQQRTIRGKVAALSLESISLVVDGKATEIYIDHISRIVRRGDSVWNGALIGLAAGAATGFLAVSSGSCDPRAWGPCFDEPRFVAAVTLLFGGVGAGVGAGVDALIRRERVVYQRGASPVARVIPLVGKEGGGARVAVSW